MPPDSINRRPFQYGIIDLLALTTVVAIVLGWGPTCFRSFPFAIASYFLIGVGQMILAWQKRHSELRSPRLEAVGDLAIVMAVVSLPAWILTMVLLPLHASSALPWLMGRIWEPVAVVATLAAACSLWVAIVAGPASLLGLPMMREWTKNWRLTLLLLFNIAQSVCLVAIGYHQLPVVHY